MNKFFLGVLSLLSLSSVFAKGKMDNTCADVSWISTPYASYSADKYFVAVGSDNNKTEAELKAVEKLAAIFGQDVNSQKTSSLNSDSHESGDAGSYSVVNHSLDVQMQNQVGQQDLIGIEIRESVYNKKESTWYVLALIDKEKTAELYEKLIQNNYETIKRLKADADSRDDSIEKIASLNKAYVLARENEILFPRFYIVHPGKCEEVEKKIIPSAVLKLESQKVAQKIPCKVVVSGNGKSNEVFVTASSVLENPGFVINEGNPVYVLYVDINFSNRKIQNPEMYYCEYSLTVELKGNNRTLAPWCKNARAGGKTLKMAENVMRNAVCKLITDDYRVVFEKMLNGELE